MEVLGVKVQMKFNIYVETKETEKKDLSLVEGKFPKMLWDLIWRHFDEVEAQGLREIEPDEYKLEVLGLFEAAEVGEEERDWVHSFNGEDWELSEGFRETAITEALFQLVEHQVPGEAFSVGDVVEVSVGRARIHTPDRWLDADGILDRIEEFARDEACEDYPPIFGNVTPLRSTPIKARERLSEEEREARQKKQDHLEELEEQLRVVVRAWSSQHGYKPNWWVPADEEVVHVRVLSLDESGSIEEWEEYQPELGEELPEAHVIRIADWSECPAGRHRSISKWSAEAFREDVLIPAFMKHDFVRVNFDDTFGTGSSWLEEVFGGLVRVHGMTLEALRGRLELDHYIEERAQFAWQMIEAAHQRKQEEVEA